jgi:predicted RNA binding protein YcfA (HicA-like mRNA interferase family)
MLRLLKSQLGYEVVRQEGSHCVLRAKGRPQIVFAFHDGATVSPRVVRAILVQQAGLTLAEAEEVVKHA